MTSSTGVIASEPLEPFQLCNIFSLYEFSPSAPSPLSPFPDEFVQLISKPPTMMDTSNADTPFDQILFKPIASWNMDINDLGKALDKFRVRMT